MITQDVDAIILSTHDEAAAAPLVKKAVDGGIAVIIVNSDIANFPTPVHGVVGYSQRTGTHKIGDYLLEKLGGKPAKVGVIEGLPGYHSTERVGGFLDAVKDKPGIEIVASIPGGWNVEGGNTAGMDLLQANPEINVVFAANDYMIMGVAQAAKELGKSDLILLGNDGDTGLALSRSPPASNRGPSTTLLRDGPDRAPGHARCFEQKVLRRVCRDADNDRRQGQRDSGAAGRGLALSEALEVLLI